MTAGHQPFFHVLHQIAFPDDKPDHDVFCHSASPTGPAETHLFKGTNPALKKPSNIPEIYAKMFKMFKKFLLKKIALCGRY